MQLLRGIQQISPEHQPSVVTIGNFDGVHLGHQQVIKTLLQQSVELSAPATVITFEPLAKEFFRPGSVPRLSSIEQRAEMLFALGVDRVLCIDFDEKFAAFSPQDFVQQVLIDGLGARYLCVGDDFKFGKNRTGDFDFLRRYGAEHGFAVTSHQTFTLNGERVSSGRVRQALQANDFSLAADLLGRPYTINGLVSYGQQLGRTLGYPTANIVLDDTPFAVNGVYAVRVELLDGALVHGVANVGKRPTVDGSQQRLEVHLFDFDANIYHEKIAVEFVHKIRDEEKFASLDLLKAQIAKDAQAARAFFTQKSD